MLESVCHSDVIEDPVLLAMTLRNNVIGFRRYDGRSGVRQPVSRRRFAEERNTRKEMLHRAPTWTHS